MERHTTNRLIELTTKQQRVRLTPGPPKLLMIKKRGKTFLEEMKKTQRMIEQQMESMKHQSGDTLEDARKKLIKEKVDNFILFNEKRGGKLVIVNYSDFKIKDGQLHVQAFGSSREIPLEFS